MTKHGRGFTLLELLVAMTILGVGFSLVFAGMSDSTRSIARLEQIQDRRFLIRNLLSKLELVQDFRAGDEAGGIFQDGTRWRFEVQPFSLASNDAQNSNTIVRIDLRLEWDGKTGVQTRTIETYRFVRNPLPAARGLEDQLRALERE